MRLISILLSQWKALPIFIRIGQFIGLLALILYVIGGFAPLLVEIIYGRYFYPFIAPKLALVFGLISWSLTDISLIFVIALLVLSPFLGLLKALLKKRKRFSALGSFIGWGCGIWGYVFALYIILWGFNYLRPSIDFQLNLPEISVERETQLLKLIARKTNTLRSSLPGDKKGCVVSSLSIEDADRAIEKYQNEILSKYNFPTYSGGGSKTRMFSKFWLQRGAAGIYGPFTGERNIVWPVAPASLTTVIAHERAHFAGFAKEDTANFWSILTAWSVPNNEMQYSGWFTFWRLLPKSALITYELSTDVKRDFMCLVNFSRVNVGLEAESSKELYDLWLKSQGVTNGSQSYNEAIGLLLRYLNQNSSLL